MGVPESRIVALNQQPLNASGHYVLYWMIAARRPHHNFSLDRAMELARRSSKPLLVFEPLRAGYGWASDRFHRFVLDGMAENAEAFARAGITYRAYVEPKPGAGRGLLKALAEKACAVVTDDYPCFFLPRMVKAAAAQVRVSFEQVDGNGLLPLRASDRAFLRAVDYRRFVQRTIATALEQRPHARVPPSPEKSASLPTGIQNRWQLLDSKQLGAGALDLSKLPIDHEVGPAPLQGGYAAARRALSRFVERRLEGYADDRNDPDAHATSGLSPYLHFGHLSAHEVFEAIAEAEDFDPARDGFGARTRGEREGFWPMAPGAQAFLDQLVTWRELGFNFCHHRPDDYDRYEALPAWARATLHEHAKDERRRLYTLDELAAARTYDPIWNAAQRELVATGRIHNYLRMLWGKKVLEWSRSPEHALDALVELNNRYALDGRDPNSYSGIFWCFGRYDRAWGPERPIFGTIRYMSSDNTRRKLRLAAYLERWGEPETGATPTKTRRGHRPGSSGSPRRATSR